ncbi:MAG: hypothetical protein B7Y85_04095 [Brevundimonas sp. 32-68-21]|uniref:Uncharacterized protein n=1 Tax=Brevundimonas mediterranea TaxID=74329 RepID=A0AB37E5C9_9CAUL|nr:MULTISPECIES: hypothetical protein [Brevundimonas]MBA4330696.1 hypothetical protein [Brevundimonas sp.]OYX80871.1 MAG: hypothetical protein B7Y85_04095 [Brevundimonas sp. 32-68-21]QIH72568.1 hypothetical protein GYM46_06140 [Brevundimonas mediterranea]
MRDLEAQGFARWQMPGCGNPQVRIVLKGGLARVDIAGQADDPRVGPGLSRPAEQIAHVQLVPGLIQTLAPGQAAGLEQVQADIAAGGFQRANAHQQIQQGLAGSPVLYRAVKQG